MMPAMLEEPEGPRNEDGAGQSEVRPRRWLWRWVVPIGAAVLVAGVVVGIVVAQPDEDDLPVAGGDWPSAWKPRFMVTAGRSADVSKSAESPWFQVHGVTDDGREQVVASVPPPSPSAGKVSSVVAGPGKMFVVSAWRANPCETVLYRFKLTDEGQAEDITPVTGGRIPALVAGLAISPDGRRIAYATAPCGEDPERSPEATTPISLAVLETITGQRREWTSGRATVVGEIVWASDSRTVGYTTGEVTSTTPPADPPPTNSREVPRGATVGPIQVRALHSEAPGTDLLAGRLLFNPSAETSTVGTVSTAVMNPDGRSGYGVLHKEEPPSTVIFSFSEGEPMRVTKTIAEDPKRSVAMVSAVGSDGPRYACLNGVDAFGRVSEGRLRSRSGGARECSTAYETPN
jgi:hypothetical protein